ncbi:S8 family serine peptidase [Cellulomonas humilata]|uniref:S8 family serine peptidase n=1 Tax=Cellulomonas humilata TaxID=144055 RepID=A0A7Y6A302_9CELL|nr:S8 family serine peptidase [Cellulomonas humilata]NUU18821.1 S8 family serine peptidase [Cellulomonas humilata]
MPRRPVLAAVTALSVAVSTALLGAGGASAAPPPTGTGFQITKPSGQTELKPGRYIVTLADDAVATYDGGVSGFAATTPDEGDQLNARKAPVKSYREHLTEKQESVAEAAGVSIDVSYTLALNGFSADLTARQAADLLADHDVVSVVPDELRHITAEPSTSFLGLEGPGGVWEAVGGADEAGAGVVVGVLDTGIAPENPAFAGDALGTTPGAEPYLDGTAITYLKGDGNVFRGVCETGEQFTADDCSTKVVGARYYLDGFGAENLGDASTGEYISPRDGDSHGSHTASTAAGNVGTPAAIGGIDFGTISGVAPAARIAAYKVCWSGPDPVVTTDDGCTTTDILSAIDQAVADGVDVINFSIGGGAATSVAAPEDQAFLGAAAAGVFVAVSAGNDGPGASTTDHASPWYTSVAATTIPSYEATVTFGDGQAFAGASITVDMDPAAEPLTGALVNSTAVALTGGTGAALCAPGSLDPALVAPGTIIVCERGTYARTDKSAEVARVGGIGMVLVNVTPGSIDTDFHAVPTVHLSHLVHDEVVAYAATPGATATFTTGNELGTTPPVPQVAGFSSRGPVLAGGSDIIKPDIAAPGVSILAAAANAEGAEPTYEFLSGTSMASPHIAGIAALYLGERPNATPAEIKSAMMTTAYDTVDDAGDPATDPFAQGAGHVDPTKFFEPGLLYLNGLTDWYAYLGGVGYDVPVEAIDPSDLNIASIGIGSLTAPETITRTVTATQAGTFTSSVQGLAGITTVVEPATLVFGAAGESKTYSVTFSRTDAPLDEFSTGSLTWTSGDTAVRSPIAVQPVTIVAPASVAGTGVTGSVAVEVTPGGDGDIPLATTGLSAGELLADPTGTETEHSGSGSTGDFAEYLVDVPEGAQYARFNLDALDDTADLDLVVYLLDADGNPVAGWQSASGSADERVNLVQPDAGTYAVLVDVYSAPNGVTWDTTVTSVVEGGAPLALDPAVLPGVQGVPVTYTASWADLTPQTTYLGLVSYGDTGVFTVVQVATGEPATPTTTTLAVTGNKTVGSELTLTATVAPTEAEGTVTFLDGQTPVGSSAVTDGTASVKVTLGAGAHSLTASFAPADASLFAPSTSEAVPVEIAKSTSTTTFILSRTSAPYGQSTKAAIVVKGATAPPTGTVEIKDRGVTIATGTVTVTGLRGVADVVIPGTLRSGNHHLTAVYTGNADVSGSQAQRWFSVTKVKAKASLTATSWTVSKGAKPVVTVSVTGPKGAPAPTGSVSVSLGLQRVATVPLTNGVAKVTLPAVQHSTVVLASYNGDGGYLPTATSHALTVRR